MNVFPSEFGFRPGCRVVEDCSIFDLDLEQVSGLWNVFPYEFRFGAGFWLRDLFFILKLDLEQVSG